MKKAAASGFLLCVVIICYAFTKRHAGSFPGTPQTKEQLGEVLFFEKKLSADGSISCASCHIPEHGFADTVAFSRGVGGKAGRRNAPSCANLASRPYLFYDGRAATLEEQVYFPIEDQNEMNIPVATVIKRLSADSQYVEWFRNIFNSMPTKENLGLAIAAYEKTLEMDNTPFDRFMEHEDSTVIGASAARGREIFLVKGRCFECHFSPDFTGDEFRNIGLFNGRELNDSGRYAISGDPADIGKFKVPGLRNVAVTAPYMHNGMFKTLRQVIDYYDDPRRIVPDAVNTDSLLRTPLHLTEQDKSDLEAFLYTLTDDRYRK